MKTRKENIEIIMKSVLIARRKFMFEKAQKAVKKSKLSGFIHPKKLNITPSQWGVMVALIDQEKMSLKDIAKILDISSSAATQLVDELVSKKYLIRKEHNKDRRLVSIEISPSHKKKMAEVKKWHEKRLMSIYECLSPDELNVFASLNKKIADRILNN